MGVPELEMAKDRCQADEAAKSSSVKEQFNLNCFPIKNPNR